MKKQAAHALSSCARDTGRTPECHKIYYSGKVLKNCKAICLSICNAAALPFSAAWNRSPGAARKHLDTREYKQQQEENNRLAREGLLLVRDALRTIGRLGQREAELKQRVADYERQAEEAESLLREEEPLPEASLFNYRRVLEMSAQTISRLRTALSAKHLHRTPEE